jgi:hypothetical protein
MVATFKVHQQGDEKYKNRKGVDVVSKRVTLLELGNDGEKLEQFLEYSLTEDDVKAHGDKLTGKTLTIAVLEMGNAFAGKPRIAKGRIQKVA